MYREANILKGASIYFCICLAYKKAVPFMTCEILVNFVKLYKVSVYPTIDNLKPYIKTPDKIFLHYVEEYEEDGNNLTMPFS